MRVKLTTNGERYEGEPLEIIGAMHYRAWGWEERPITEYMAWLVEQARERGATIELQPAADENTASQLVFALIEAGILMALPTPAPPASPSTEAQRVNEVFKRAKTHFETTGEGDAWQGLTPLEQLALVMGALDQQWRGHGRELWQALVASAGDAVLSQFDVLEGTDARVVARLAQRWCALDEDRAELAQLEDEDPDAADDAWQRLSYHENAIIDAYHERREAFLAALAAALNDIPKSAL